ncbi:hypothetical protein NKJ36_03795 [Mesorhizobium sp. M0142]|uniref:hypothetical protein n=1 Tax=Mesorhizobium sp. M0142 TaxID=2956894 RepID=UPI003336803F
MDELDERALSVTRFWRHAGEDAWFEKNDAFDADFRTRFLDLHFAAARRNRMLGRETTPDEQMFLDGGGFSG